MGESFTYCGPGLTVVTKLSEAGVQVCRVRGEVDVSNDRLLRDALRSMAVAPIVVDLTRVSFLSLCGVDVLLAAALPGRRVELVVTARPLLRILELSGATAHLRVYNCLQDALTAQSVGGVPLLALDAVDERC
ncbi:STAS domain-containing protein [Nocardia arthritidis]